MAKTVESISTPTHDEIAARAYEIYLREGCAAGRDTENWLKAEAELRASSNRNANANGNGHAVLESPLQATPTLGAGPRSTAPKRATAKR